MNSARLISTRFGGVVWSPRPARRNDSATANRVKLVTMMSSPGATDSTVSSAMSWMMRPLVEPLPGGSSELRSGIWANATSGSTTSSNASSKTLNFTESPTSQ